MQVNLKAIFKNKLVGFIFLFFTVIYFLCVIKLSNNSVARGESNYLQLESIAKTKALWKENDLQRAKSQDQSQDKYYYNNFKKAYDQSSAKVNKLLKKYADGEEISNREFEQTAYLTYLINNEHISGLYGKDYIRPTKAYPEKIDKFLENLDLDYNIYDLDFLNPSKEVVPYKDNLAYGIKGIELQLDSYLSGKNLPLANEYSIYNFLRNINYGSNGSIFYWLENFFIASLPLLVFYLIKQERKNGTIKNIYLQAKDKQKIYLYFLFVFIIFALTLVYVPKIISYLYVTISGDHYRACTDLTIVEKGLRSFETTYEGSWSTDANILGLTNRKLGTLGDHLDYYDLKTISFFEFLKYFLTIDILKIILLVIVASSISLFIKNKAISFSLNAFIGTMTILGGKINSRFFLNKFNPFILPNGWKLTLGREYISYYNAKILLLGWIILILGISLFLARKRDLE